MSDTKITENDDDELIVVETPPEGTTDDNASDDDGVEDQDDDRLATSDDDHDDEIASGTKERDRRRKRREIQKRARDAAQLELQQLRETVANLTQRIAATETHAANTNAQSLEQRLAAAIHEVQQAEHVIAKATEAGNGDDVVAAMRMRDQAISTAQQLQAYKQQYEQARRPRAPAADPQVVSYAKQWMDANPWYDPKGGDRDSAVTKAIDTELTREGLNPRTRQYWEELTTRVADALGDDAPAASKPRRRGPPTGSTREHAPASTKKEIYVTPERKQAMIDAGVWDDPMQRQRYLKAYQAYDNSSAR